MSWASFTGRGVERFCHNAGCAAWFGVTIHEHPATETDPPYLDTDSCPRCGEDLHDRPIDTCSLQDTVEGVFTDYVEAGDDVDYPALAVVIARELDRQRIARWDAMRRAVKPPASRAKEAGA